MDVVAEPVIRYKERCCNVFDIKWVSHRMRVFLYTREKGVGGGRGGTGGWSRWGGV